MRLPLPFLFPFFLCGPVLATDAAGGAPVLVLGDSISTAYGIAREDGWVALLQRRLDERRKPGAASRTVVNASISGETTDGGLRRLPELLRRHAPAVVIVELGGNDGLRGFPTARIEANLGAMLEAAQTAGARTLLVGIPMSPNYGRRYVEAYQAAFVDAAERHRTPLTSVRIEDLLEPGMIQQDGIHPTTKAQPLLLEAVWGELEGLLEDVESHWK